MKEVVKKQKRERIESKINKAKVAKEILKNPLQSQREIAKNAWVTVWTVNNKLNQLKQSKDDRILWICDTDIQNVVLGQNILQKRMQENPDKLKASDIVQIIAEGTKRYTIFKWDITDDEWWLKQVISEEKRQQILDRLEESWAI